jgi:hypothetical protein
VVVILANPRPRAPQTYPGIERVYGDTLDRLNTLFLAFFVVEITLRVAAYGRRPWRFLPRGQERLRLRRRRAGVRARAPEQLDDPPTRAPSSDRPPAPDVRILITAVIRIFPPLGCMAILTTLILFIYGK